MKHSIEYLPISIFAITLGFSGATLVAQRVFPYVLGVPVADGLLVFTCVLFAWNVLWYGYKVWRYPSAVRDEVLHPVRLAFFPTITISILVGAILFVSVAPIVSWWLWVIGAVGHAFSTLFIVSMWLQRTNYTIEHMNPAWFIPAVGNLIVPIAGATHAPTELLWWFFSIGFLFWISLLTIFFNRIIFHNPLPERLVPTLCILLAPPSIGFIALAELYGEVSDVIASMYYLATFFFLLLLAQLNLFWNVRFALSWWAYSFPFAAFTLATLRYAHATESALLYSIAEVLGCALAVIMTVLTVLTIRLILRGQLCVPD